MVCALTALVAALFSLDAAAQSRILRRISVVGAQTVQPQQVIAWSQLAVDQPLTRDGVAEAIRRIFVTGKFADVFVYESPRADGIELILNVTEFPRLSDVRWEGLDKLKREDLEQGMDLRVGDHLSPARVRRGLDGVRAKYKAEGYYNATVDTDFEGYVPGQAQVLTIRVVEGKKVSVRKLSIVGNVKLSSEDLRKGFKTKEDGWLTSGTFKLPEFQTDLQTLVTNFRENGYLDAVVSSHELNFVEHENKLDIVIHVEEGKQYRFGNITWTGNTVHGDEAVTRLIRVKGGDVWRESEFQELSRSLHNLYWEDGYIYIVVTPNRVVRGEYVDLEFAFDEGRPARVRRVEIVGNSKTHENVIRRELQLLPGDLFSNTQLQDSQRRVFQLGFFNDVGIDYKPAGETGEDIDLSFNVEEKQTGNFTMGVGFSQQTNASGFFNIGENNLFGRGQSLQFAWQFGSRRSFLDLSYTEPWFLGTPTLVGADLFNRYSNQVNDFYDNRQKGFALRAGRPIPGTRFSRFTLRYSLIQTTLSNFDPLYVQILDDQEAQFGASEVPYQRLDDVDWPQTTSAVTLTLSRNSTDNPFFPTGGSRSTARYEFNGGPLGGDLDYQKMNLEHDLYRPLPLKLAFHLNASTGLLWQFGSTSQVPDYERFRLGGNRYNPLRGYEDLSIVPHANADVPFIGGTFYTVFTTELLYPVARMVHLLGFVDHGDTWNRFSESDLTDLRTGAGFGVRLEVPLVGRIGFDFGYGFDKPDPGWETHFNFGSVF